MKRILVGTDGSDASFRAAALAAKLASATGAQLYALEVVRPSDYRHNERWGFLSPADQFLDLPTQVEEAVAGHLARCDELARQSGISEIHRTNRVADDVALEILDFAHRHEIDLIVIGKRGRGRLSGLLLGSVSQKLASAAQCSVLVAC